MAVSLIRKGRDPLRVADTTGVPLALVELLAEHLPTRAPAHLEDPFTTPPRPPWPPTPSPQPPQRYGEPAGPWATPRPPPLARSRAWWLLTATLPMLTNLGLALAAAADHRPALAAVSLMAAAPMFVMSVLLTRH